MTHRNNSKNIDRVILFEIGIIIALLLVNFGLNLSYKVNLPQIHTEENILEDQPFQLVELTEKKEDFKEERMKTKEIAKLFDPRSMIKQVDDLFDLKINKIQLMTNSQQTKRVGMIGYGLEIIDYVTY